MVTFAPAQAPSVALILPSQQTDFAAAAEALRQGFFAAREADARGPAIQVVEVDDDIELLAIIDTIGARGVRLAVGPLPRVSVNALVEGGHAPLPMLALNYPERDAGAPTAMIALGLSAEAEAQYVVRRALADVLPARRAEIPGPRFVVLVGSGALERRLGNAFVGALRAAGEAPLVVETGAVPGQIGARFDVHRHDGVFLALDARQAGLIRAQIPRAIPAFGTSLLNAGPPTASPEAASLAHDLDGVRFVDMPWLLRGEAGWSDAAALPPAGMPVELARLYALGVDAYRVALRWGVGEARFRLDGVTGHLHLDRADGPRIERTPDSAIYRNGQIERDTAGR